MQEKKQFKNPSLNVYMLACLTPSAAIINNLCFTVYSFMNAI